MQRIYFILSFILIGLLVFYAKANFNNLIWQHIYGIWDKLKDVLLLYYIYNTCIKIKSLIKPVLVLLIIRLVWELISLFFGISINSNAWIRYLFIATTLTCLPFLIKELKQTVWRRK